VKLANLPTPVHLLERLSDHLGVEVWVKRDDLTGFGLSGNKVRKLERLLDEASSQGAEVLLTTGGIQSNHCRATAVAARQRGLDVHLLLRGERPAVAESNLLLDDLLGAAIAWCTPEDYRHRRDALLASMADAHQAKGRVPYVIPEGGSNGLGSLAFVDAVDELRNQDAPEFDAVVCAVGSGGTAAGLAMAGVPLVGFAVCDDVAYFTDRIHHIAADAKTHGGPDLPNTWRLEDRWRGPAYAVATEPVWDAIRTVARLEGLFLDPVYTGKAMHGLFEQARAGELGERVLFWHTGGAFGLFGRGQEVA
jgi:D-cysteine desulfhydrase